MCGISGFFDTTGLLDKADLVSMNSSMRHRGPDSGDIYIDGPCGLAHRRLGIIDPSHSADQPMKSDCGRYIIVYNGEVYNFHDILKQIQLLDPNYKPKSKSDTEIVLHAFKIWGEDFLNRLNGMFAMAIYDNHDRKLFLCRDRLGVKPLYYHYDNGCLIFASELKAIIRLQKLHSRLSINNSAVRKFLHLGYIPAPLCIYNEVKKFEKGTFAKADTQGITFAKWWQPEAVITEIPVTEKEEAILTLETLLESSVRYRLISDVPYGTFLSGGIDSSLVTAIAQKVSNRPIDTFTVGFPGTRSDEAPFAKKIATYIGTRHNELLLTQKEILDWLPEFFNTYDEPFADSSGIPSLIISHFARKQVKMTLSGDGGDELFLGYGAYRWAKRLRHNPPGWLRAIASSVLMAGNQRMQRASALFRYENSKSIKSHIFSQEQYCFSEKEINEYLLNKSNNFSLYEHFEVFPRELGADEQQALFDLRYYLPDDLLVKVDRATMAASLETRVPLLDYRIVEFALNLHPSLKYNNGNAKYLLKELLARYIPAELFEREKRGFSIPLSIWLQNELKFLADEYLSPESIKETGILNPLRVERLLKDFYVNKKHYLYQRVWLLIVLQRWIILEKT